MSKHTLEQVLEALLNKEEDRASDLLHQFFVAKGKSIYEELSQLDQQLEEEELEEEIGGAAQDDFRDEIIADESELEDEALFAEADDEPADPMAAADEPTEPEATADLAMGDEEGMEEPAEPAEGGEGAEGEAEEALNKVEDALDELKAAFAEIMGEPAPAGEMPADMGGEEEKTEEGFDPLGESAKLVAVPAPTHGDDGDKSAKSPVSSGPKVSDNGAKAVKVNSGNVSGGTEGGLAKPSATAINTGNVNVPGNKKAPVMKSVAAPKNSDTASNKTSPVAK